MDLAAIVTIASEVLKVAIAIVQDGRRQATPQEVARLRALTEIDIGQIEKDAG